MTPTISPEQRRALDEGNGQPIFVVDPERQERFVLIAASDARIHGLLRESTGSGRWSEEKEARRRELIDKDIAGVITLEQAAELAILNREGNEHYDKIAPRPMDGARRLHQELLKKRGADILESCHARRERGELPTTYLY
ncbi:MAG: hypothetical protein KY475_20550 [Planctomycetes bacterium]|nr:hypothetical protein [Planctomycetota bacterium]